MSEAPLPPPEEDLPTPAVRNRRWIPRLVWVVPIVAAAIGISLLVRNWANEGPRITISFLSGEGSKRARRRSSVGTSRWGTCRPSC
jgi:paraquat-inducible protein B